jgi:TolB protein
MDFDGQNQQQMTRHASITKMPAVSPDGRLVAYVTMQNTRWELRVINTETRRQQAFVTPATSTITTPEFSPDGKKLWFSIVINDSPLQIVRTNVDGGGLERVSQARAIELSARVNPKTGTDVIFISDRNRHQQLYKMNLDGTGIEMLTPGDGDVSNPAWSPDGRQVTFAWNHGLEPGNFNIFVMNVAKRELVQLTHGNGTNENPYWAPDGVHIVYSNRRGNSTQIYTMLANGQRVKQLTSAGNNLQPVWAAKLN